VRLSRNKVMQEIHAQLVRRTTLLRSLITADFDYCNLLDDHSRVVDLLEKGRLKQAMDLIDTHHRSVVRGYIMDREVFAEMTPAEALAPYLDGAADAATTAVPLRRMAKPNGNGDAATHVHVHLPKTDPAPASRASAKKTNRGLPS